MLDAVASPGVSQVTLSLVVSVAPPPCTLLIPNSPGFYVCTIATGPTIYGWMAPSMPQRGQTGLTSYSPWLNTRTDRPRRPSCRRSTWTTKRSPTVVVPENDSTVSGTQVLDCVTPSDAGAPVSFNLTGTGGSGPLGEATLTKYGWIYEWNTTDVTDGPYSLNSDATYPFGGSRSGGDISVTVSN